MFKKKIAIALTLLCAATMPTLAQPLVLTSPQDYEVYDISPNGKWACGGYSDYSYNYYGFRWNLETNEVELLSTTEESLAWSVADDGTVAGTFQDTQVLASGNPVEMAGYYKDGAWHHLEVPEGGTSGQGYGISTDGHYMVGEVDINGVYTTVIWKDGKIYKNFYDGLDAIPWCISPDGQMAAGWGYPTAYGNRCSALWKVSDGSKTWLTNIEHFACGAKNFSPDGKKIVFWGGYKSYDENDDPLVASVYDVATGEVTYLPTPGEQGIYLYDITNSGMVLGEVEQNGGGYIWKNGQHIDANTFLNSYNVSLDNIDVYRDSVTNEPFILRAASASEDENRLAFLYYDTEGAVRSMVVFLNVQTDEMNAPTNVTATQLQGINAVALTWKQSVLGKTPDGYNIYRDGTKVNSTPVTTTQYFDKVPSTGSYSYVVSAIYGDTEKSADAVTATVAAKETSAPQTPYARQKGINGARLQWTAPASNYICRTYYDPATAELSGFGTSGTTVSFEAAIKFDKEDIALYNDNKLTKVQFYPMDSTATGWKVTAYTRDANGTLTSIYTQDITQTLQYNTLNTVTLNTPVTIPDGELIVAIGAKGNTSSILGMDYGQTTAGYSDLVRQATESDFYSLKTASSGGYLLNWYINALFAPEGTAGNKDDITHYTVYADGESQGTTQSLNYVFNSLTDGQHTLGVSASYADGATSAISTADVTVATKGVDANVAINGSTAVDVTWEAPTNTDNTTVTYATGKAKVGPTGPSDNGYGYMAGAIYLPEKFKGYDGYQVKSFRFYPNADALFTIYLLKDGVQIYEQEVDDYTLHQWNVIEPKTPITIDEKSTYQLVVDCYDVTEGEAPMSIDDQAPYISYSDVYSLDGESWTSLSETGMQGNWMMGMDIYDPTAAAVNVAGYDVNIDGKKVNGDKLTTTQYTHDFGVADAIEHSASVDVYYGTLTESVKGNATYFTLSALAAIDAATVEKLNLHVGDNFLTVEGGATTIEAYNASGAKVAAANGDKLNITSLAPGVYVIRAKTANGTLTRTIEVSK